MRTKKPPKKGALAVRASPRSRGRVRAEGAEFPLVPLKTTLPSDYVEVLADIKSRIVDAQRRAVLAASRELIALYFYVGATIAARQAMVGWGHAVVERLAHDLREAFPALEGFSTRNIWRMRAFFVAWSPATRVLPQAVAELAAPKNLPQAVAELPWGHNALLIEKIKSPATRLWYAEQTRLHGWSRSDLTAQITRKTHARQGKVVSNFAHVLPAAQSALAQQALKDPYLFDFLTVGREAHERVLERELLAHVREFLLELGAGFAFIGSQVKLVVGEQEYFVDLLFYHLKLRAYVVVELKATAFKPEHVGQMNFYLSAVDDLLKHKDDQPSIGLLLCKSKNQLRVEYALRGYTKPIGVAKYETKLLESLPKELEGVLPTVEQIEAEFSSTRRDKP
jgi:predicted nuclease of restriction endonuclease-like (RecB) superfamily